MDADLLRKRLVEAVEAVLDEFTEQTPSVQEDVLDSTHHLDIRAEAAPDVSYRWPDAIVRYQHCRRVRINDGTADYPFVIGWQTRPTFGREDRGRWVVFSEYRGESSIYPVIEFTETDNGRYSAVIPKEDEAGRLKATDEIPTWFERATLQRTDELFESVRNGPSMRVVVEKDDFVGMALHGYWAGTVRHQLPRQVPIERPEVTVGV